MGMNVTSAALCCFLLVDYLCRWTDFKKQDGNYRIPTVVYYGRDGRPCGFGYMKEDEMADPEQDDGFVDVSDENSYPYVARWLVHDSDMTSLPLLKFLGGSNFTFVPRIFSSRPKLLRRAYLSRWERQ